MPGDRLTYEDRQRIAAGVADGLSYAEIARRLDRPTSTVTREVLRNGGARGYRAEQADRATRGRARRRRDAPDDAAAATAVPDGRDPAAVRELEELLTAVIVRTGLSRMTARVLTSLYVADSGSATAAELVDRLRVSPASISKAVGELESQALVKRAREPGGRRDRYVIDDDIWYRSWLASAQMNATIADAAGRGVTLLGAATPAGARLGDMSRFLRQVGEDMLRAAERWRAEHPAGQLPT